MIRGIDSQIMIQRSVDYAKRAGDQIGNAEQGKDFIAMMEKERSLHDTKSVKQLEHAEHRRINKEKQKDEEHSDQQEKNKKRKYRGLDVGSEIDIDV